MKSLLCICIRKSYVKHLELFSSFEIYPNHIIILPDYLDYQQQHETKKNTKINNWKIMAMQNEEIRTVFFPLNVIISIENIGNIVLFMHSN